LPSWFGSREQAIADEMREEYRRRVAGRLIDRPGRREAGLAAIIRCLIEERIPSGAPKL
jgi:hypothetical protein